MSSEISENDLQKIRLLVENSELSEIVTHEISSKRYDTPTDIEDEAPANVELSLQHRIADNNFGIRMKVLVKTSLGETAASVSGEYKILNDHKLVKRDVLLFANEIAVMTIFPYVREAVSTTSTKVFGQPLLLPMLARGVIGFEIEAAT